MITFSGVIGIGFYTRSGTILRTSGQLALFLAFTLLTALTWGVMQCITEMLSIWPVPGALVEFVRTFLDEDLAITVGIAYWYVLSSAIWAPLTSSSSILLPNDTKQVHLRYHLPYVYHRYSWGFESSKST